MLTAGRWAEVADGLVNHNLPPYNPAARAANVQIANRARDVLPPAVVAATGVVEEMDPDNAEDEDVPEETAPDARESLDAVSGHY